MYEQVAQGCYLKVERPGVEPATFCVANALTTTPPGHTITVRHVVILFETTVAV